MKNTQYLALLFADCKSADLYPLSRGISVGSLPVGNKKMIVYQLEQLETINNILKIVILYEQQNGQIIEDLQQNFFQVYSDYKHRQKVQFFQVYEKQTEYLSFQQYLNSKEYAKLVKTSPIQQGNLIEQTNSSLNQNVNLLLVPINTICTPGCYASAVEEYQSSDSDLTLLLKLKKQYGHGEKQPQVDLQPDYDIAMIGEGQSNYNKMLSLISVVDYEYSGFQIHESIYKQVISASLKKVIDSGFYVVSPKIAQIARKMITEDITYLKPDFIQAILTNQTNSNLLKFISQNKAIKVNCKIYNQDQFIRKIPTLKLYEQINFQSLIRGNKERKALLPTKYTNSFDQNLMKQHRTTFIGADSNIEKGGKIRRSCVGNNCMIGKNVDIENSLIMNNCVIMDGCKIKESIVGPYTILGQNASLYQCKLAQKCKIDQDKKLEGEIIWQ